MIECKLYILDIGRTILNLGRQGENNATKFLIDATRWTEEWPEGNIRGAFKTPDGVLRETKMTLAEGVIEWPITSSETALPGNGELELQLTDSEGTVVKSATCTTVVSPSMTYKADTELQPPFDTSSGSGEKGPKGDQGDPGVGISNVKLNEDYTLTITLTDGSSYTTESVRGPEGAKGEPGVAGEKGPAGPAGSPGADGAQGAKGDQGASISNVTLQDDYGLKIDLDNGESFVTASVRGEKGERGERGEPGLKGEDGKDGSPGSTGAEGPQGEKGNGIKNVELQEDYTLKITMDDETVYTTTSVRGEKGEDGKDGTPGARGPEGPKGADGEPGQTGPKGDQGASISSITLEDDYGLKIELDDGSSYKTASVRGPKGEDGTNGSPGQTGPAGPSGERGSKFYFGTYSTPSSDSTTSDSKENDLYLNTSNFDLHRKTSSGWTKLGCIKGDPAESGGTADTLATPRTIQTKLNSEDAVAFDGSQDIEPGVLGVLGVKHGGTGATNAQDAQIALGVPQITFGAGDMTPGESTLKSGRFFFCYEL